jgi:hypothetical protein
VTNHLGDNGSGRGMLHSQGSLLLSSHSHIQSCFSTFSSKVRAGSNVRQDPRRLYLERCIPENHSSSSSWNRRVTASATVLHANLFTAIDLPRCPSLVLSSPSEKRRRIASANNRESLAGRKMPASPIALLSPIPSVTTTGFAQAIASGTTFDMPSDKLGKARDSTRSLEMQVFSDLRTPERPRSSRRPAVGPGISDGLSAERECKEQT